MLQRDFAKHLDWLTVGFAIALVVVGLIFVQSASVRPGDEGESYYLSKPQKQVMWMCAGLLVAVVVLLIDYRWLAARSDVFYILGMLALLGLLVLEMQRKNTMRWFLVAGHTVQPSEFMKLAVILVLAKYLVATDSANTLKGLLGPALLTLCPMVLIAKQPDLGTALVFVPLLFAAIYVAGARHKHVLSIIGAGLLCLPLLWFGLKGYQKGRVIAFFNQESADIELRQGMLYQLIQSKTAIGSGGLWGKGWGKGTQNRGNFLYAKDTDFIFSIILEEWGFAGSTLVLGLYFGLMCSCLSVAHRTRDPAGRLIAVGVTAYFATHVIINTGMATGLLPTVGLSLPFISYGGSGTVSGCLALGLILNVSMRPRAGAS